MDGSVVQKPKGTGRWYVVTRHRQPDGRYKQQWHGGYATRREAKATQNEVVNKINKGNHVEPTKVTVSEYLASWIDGAAVVLRPSTLDSYRRNIGWHIDPAVGHHRLQALTAGHLNVFYAHLLEAGRKDGQGGLSVKTVRYIHGIIRTSLRDAVDAGLIVQNVATKAKPPKLKAAKARDMQTWTAAELRRFYDHLRGDRLFAIWRVLGQTGMRRGEVLGLKWDSVDLDLARISVTRTLISVNYKAVIGDAKTQKGVRVIDLDPATVAALRAHRHQQRQERLAWGPAYNDAGLVFARENGRLIHPDLLSQVFRGHVAKAGLPKIRLHDLRHTHATLALKAGVHVKVISERLGHADVAFTMNTYAHAIPGMQAEAAVQIAALVDG
jgi:integrase